jgi:hypothetical protein
MKTLSFNRITIAAFAMMFSLVLFSCQKESSLSTPAADAVTEEEAVNLSDESTQAEASFDDVEDVSATAAEEEGDAAVYGRGENTTEGLYLPTFEELRLRIGHCATVTVVPNDNTYPKTVTIDFGDGCLCADGKFRKGAIIIHLTGPIRRAGSVMTITLRNFFLNRAHIEGTKTFSNLSENSNIKFTVQVVGGKITFPNGRGYSYNSLKYVRQIEGGSTRPIRDDIYSIEGRSKTEYNGGLTVTLDTETPLIKKVVCPWINKGVLKIKINSRVLFLNYGAPNDGDCDNKALLTWNDGNNQRLITLP